MGTFSSIHLESEVYSHNCVICFGNRGCL